MTEHVFGMGATRSGKSWWANHLHRRFPGKSIFVNTKPTPDIWGTRARTEAEVLRVLAREDKVDFRIVQDDDGRILALARLKDALYRLARHHSRDPWAQVVVDEAQKYRRNKGDPVDDMVRVAGGLGIRIIVLTQYPTGVEPEIRSQCDTRIVFRPGIEGTRFLRSYGEYPTDEILAWTAQPYHFASYDSATGWVMRTPVSA